MKAPVARRLERADLPFAGAAALMLLTSLVLLIVRWDEPIRDPHAFRQTQTALSVWAFDRGGPLWGYETPVVGSPWTIPFEFPLFQWIVYAVHSIAGIAIEPAGRLVSWLFFVATLPLIHLLIRRLGGNRRLSFIAAALLLASPLYLYWSATFMIESAALFFSVLFLLGVVGTVQDRRPLYLAAMFAGALAAALVKVTTFAGFAVAAGLITLLEVRKRYMEDRQLSRAIRVALAPAAAFIVAAGAQVAWLRYTDELKRGNLIGRTLISSALNGWNFGSIAQRTDLHSWTHVFFGRALNEVIGWGPMFWVAVLVLLVLRRNLTALGALLILYLAPFLIFTNLHLVHGYYQYANGLFATGVVALSVWTLAEKHRAAAIGLLSVALVLSLPQIAILWTSNTREPEPTREMAAADTIDQISKADDVILVLGDDWSSEIAFYSRRRAISVPEYMKLAEVVAALPKLAGAAGLGAVADCRKGEAGMGVENIVQGRQPIPASGCVVYDLKS